MKKFIQWLLSLFGGSGSSGKSAPAPNSKQKGMGIPYYAVSRAGRAGEYVKGLAERGITIYPVELSSKRGREGKSLADNVRDFAPIDKACRKYGVRAYVWLWNSNNGNEHNGGSTNLAELKLCADLFKKLYGTYHYFNAMNEDDDNTPRSVRDGIRAHVRGIYPDETRIDYGAEEKHLQRSGGAAVGGAKYIVTDSCGSITIFHGHGCKDTNAANVDGDKLVDLLKPWHDKGHTVIAYDFSDSINWDAASKLGAVK